MLKLNFRNTDSTVIGEENGLNLNQEFENYKDAISNIIKSLNQRKDKPGQWLQWLNLGYNEETVWYVKEFASMVEGRFDNILVLGIGGSALGGLAVTEALLKPYWNLLTPEQRNGLPRIFFLDNIDPDSMNGLLDILDLSKTLVNVITKSGSTAETMSQYMIIKDRLEKELGDNYRRNIVATTDKKMGVLRQLADQEGYKTFVVPDDVGGRFSVFSAVGLVPFALVGLDIDQIMNGIKDMDLALKNTDIHQNVAAQGALIQYLLDTKKGKNLSVMMPYSSRLKYVSDWFVQLWAESLGKEVNNNGEKVNIGPTPIKAVGATDQHSQIQLYNEGPKNKVITFIRVKNFDTTLEIPKIFEYTGIGYLGGKTINDLINAEADSTRVALADYSCPTMTLTIEKIDDIRNNIFEVLSRITAGIDFPEDVREPEYSYLIEKFEEIISQIDNVLSGANTSNIFRQGASVAIVGKPNVGKSSLFNALLNLDRAIVTDIAGTTRDVLRETLDLGIPVTLVDTAGIREDEEVSKVEKIGIEYSKQSLDEADLVLFIYDASKGLDDDDKEVLELLKDKKHIVIANKADLISDRKADILYISALTGEGIAELKNTLKSNVCDIEPENLDFVTNTRQQECLKKAEASIHQALLAARLNELQDLISIDVKSAILALDELTGELITDNILDNIFEHFCIGK